jgi:hypothetical protein
MSGDYLDRIQRVACVDLQVLDSAIDLHSTIGLRANIIAVEQHAK